MPRLYFAFSCLIVLACGGSEDLSVPEQCTYRETSPMISPAGLPIDCRFVQYLDTDGGPYTPNALWCCPPQTWVWVDKNAQGEVSQRCNVATCPTGATCVVQQDVSGKDQGQQLLIGTCQ